MSVEVPVQGIRTRLGSETNTTPVAGANDTVLNTTNRYYTYFTLPTTHAFYVFTGIEVLNGTVVNGSFECRIEQVNANPPTVGQTAGLAAAAATAQSGVSSVQRLSILSSLLVPGGTICGAFVSTNSATARFGTTTVSNAANIRAIAFSAVGSLICNNTAFSNGTEEAYIKVYYKPVI